MSAPRPSENTAQVIERLMRQGGYVLACGGGLADLPEKYHQHPQIIIWDDNRQANDQKTVPSNTRAILYNRWLSHATAGRLRDAAQRLCIPVFPMLRTRDIKFTLDELLHLEPVVTATPPAMTPQDDTPPPPARAPADKGYLTEGELPMKKPERGQLKQFVAEHADITKPFAQEAHRILQLLKEKGIQSTHASVAQQIGVEAHSRGVSGKPGKTPTVGYVKVTRGPKGPRAATLKDAVKVETPRSASTVAATALHDIGDLDLQEAEKILADAKAAIEVLGEFVAKLAAGEKKRRRRIDALRDILNAEEV